MLWIDGNGGRNRALIGIYRQKAGLEIIRILGMARVVVGFVRLTGLACNLLHGLILAKQHRLPCVWPRPADKTAKSCSSSLTWHGLRSNLAARIFYRPVGQYAALARCSDPLF